jgi:hypothetical protein
MSSPTYPLPGEPTALILDGEHAPYQLEREAPKWSQEEAVSYEVARELITALMAFRSEWIALERAKPAPDLSATLSRARLVDRHARPPFLMACWAVPAPFFVLTWNPRSSSPRGVMRSTWTSNSGGSKPRLAEVPQRSHSCAACSGRFSAVPIGMSPMLRVPVMPGSARHASRGRRTPATINSTTLTCMM